MAIMRISSRQIGPRAQLLAQSHRCASTTARPRLKNASEAASYMMDKFAGKTIIRNEDIDRNQLRKLALTLNRPISPADDSRSELFTFTTVPPGYHLVYFTPEDIESGLGPDGSDQTFNALAPFTRRMWAGGKMVFDPKHPLQTDLPAEEHTKLVNAIAKTNKAGEEMVLVEVEKKFYRKGQLSVIDQRSWMFRPSLETGVIRKMRPNEGDVLAPSSWKEISVENSAYPVWQLSWSPVGLFRFSALTFNGHKIHYNEDWTRTAEGHPNAVVHGPLNLINLLDYWRNVHGCDKFGRQGGGPREIRYRAISPVYAGEKYQIRTGEITGSYPDRTFEVFAERDGVAVMKAYILEAVHDIDSL
ncbi:Mesaconyl-C(4)-CoA hydratase [Cladobotryum mycophilum]|uniref:Mesaconyl-C(4)-CoA hydratase n=1 Tax=Cladobotryum mycophilum TaxID=491253 RepID=A0ABR0SSS6_9HYPO